MWLDGITVVCSLWVDLGFTKLVHEASQCECDRMGSLLFTVFGLALVLQSYYIRKPMWCDHCCLWVGLDFTKFLHTEATVIENVMWSVLSLGWPWLRAVWRGRHRQWVRCEALPPDSESPACLSTLPNRWHKVKICWDFPPGIWHKKSFFACSSPKHCRLILTHLLLACLHPPPTWWHKVKIC